MPNMVFRVLGADLDEVGTTLHVTVHAGLGRGRTMITVVPVSLLLTDAEIETAAIAHLKREARAIFGVTFTVGDVIRRVGL